MVPVLVLLRSYDSRVKAMEVDEKPKEEYTDVGGLDKQIEAWGMLPLH
jgi:ATP-dependent 26S proteasome regulatory subunit